MKQVTIGNPKGLRQMLELSGKECKVTNDGWSLTFEVEDDQELFTIGINYVAYNKQQSLYNAYHEDNEHNYQSGAINTKQYWARKEQIKSGKI